MALFRFRLFAQGEIEVVRGLFYRGGCVLCMERDASRFRLCEECLSALPFLGERLLTEKRLPVYALFRENSLTAKMIQGLKYREERYWQDVFGGLGADFLIRKKLHEVDFICAVPTSPKKRRLRGYNPPELVARKIASDLNLTYFEGLHLQKKMRDQIGLTAKERRDNVRGGFRADPVKGKVLLVDDTYTTGATLASCREALLASGAHDVIGFVCMKAAEVPQDDIL